MVVSLIARALSKAKPVKDTIKVYRGERSDKDFRVAKNLKPKFNQADEDKTNFMVAADTKRKLGKVGYQEYSNKRDVARGRFFSPDIETAKSYAPKLSGRIVEAEISKKDYVLGEKMLEKFFNKTSPAYKSILLPKKNFKDVKENIDFYKDKVGSIAATEYKKGGMIDMTKDKKYYKGIL